MEILRIDLDFSVCKVEDYSLVDWSSDFCFAGKTDEENSLVCPTAKVPGNAIVCEPGWRALRIQGVLDFSLIGILADIAGVLAAKQIGIFAVSTYNTDYIFTKKEHFDKAVQALAEAGYQVA